MRAHSRGTYITSFAFSIGYSFHPTKEVHFRSQEASLPAKGEAAYSRSHGWL
ncbi:hypothetical protein ACFQDF_14205 [Ectobacillus funiculus]|uniref:Uncharacterized protein n=1 Tax=Ectobacillus funiculus TaxID=137993 RepID=A0ABV5WN08_9BACI